MASVSAPPPAPPQRRNSWLARIASLRRAADRPRDLPVLSHSPPSSSSSHDRLPTPTDLTPPPHSPPLLASAKPVPALGAPTAAIPAPRGRRLASKNWSHPDSYSPAPTAASVYDLANGSMHSLTAPGTLSEPNPHSMGSLAPAPHARPRKLQKRSRSRHASPPPSAFPLARAPSLAAAASAAIDPEPTYPGSASAPATVRHAEPDALSRAASPPAGVPPPYAKTMPPARPPRSPERPSSASLVSLMQTNMSMGSLDLNEVMSSSQAAFHIATSPALSSSRASPESFLHSTPAPSVPPARLGPGPRTQTTPSVHTTRSPYRSASARAPGFSSSTPTLRMPHPRVQSVTFLPSTIEDAQPRLRDPSTLPGPSARSSCASTSTSAPSSATTSPRSSFAWSSMFSASSLNLNLGLSLSRASSTTTTTATAKTVPSAEARSPRKLLKKRRPSAGAEVPVDGATALARQKSLSTPASIWGGWPRPAARRWGETSAAADDDDDDEDGGPGGGVRSEDGHGHGHAGGMARARSEDGHASARWYLPSSSHVARHTSITRVPVRYGAPTRGAAPRQDPRARSAYGQGSGHGRSASEPSLVPDSHSPIPPVPPLPPLPSAPATHPSNPRSSLETHESASSSSSSGTPGTDASASPTPSIAALSALTTHLESSSAIAASVSMHGLAGRGTMISDPRWVIGEDEREWEEAGVGVGAGRPVSFNPYAYAYAVEEAPPSLVKPALADGMAEHADAAPSAGASTGEREQERTRSHSRSSSTRSRASQGSRARARKVSQPRSRSRSHSRSHRRSHEHHEHEHGHGSRSRSRTPSRRARERNPMRRWTLAMAEAPDEVVLAEFERLRTGKGGGARGRGGQGQGLGADGEGALGRAGVRRRRSRTMMPLLRTAARGDGDEARAGAGAGAAGSETEEWEEWWRVGVRRDSVVYGGPGAGAGEDDESGSAGDVRSLELDGGHGAGAGSSGSGSGSGSGASPAEAGEVDEDEEVWQSARRALLCCRDMVKTERSYQARLLQLLNGETITTPPPLMHTYLPALVRASESLLAKVSDDPTAWGVSYAFIQLEAELEGAFVSWCGVVGEWFTTPGRRITLSKRSSHARKKSGGTSAGGPTPPLPATMSISEDGHGSPRSSVGHAPASPTTPKAPDQSWGRGLAGWRRSLPSTPVVSSANLHEDLKDRESGSPGTARTPGGREKKPTVRELAIQPTQRVMRYVLQYRDLLSHTPPTSASRAVVERALAVAERIAQKCDRAQGNAAFLL